MPAATHEAPRPGAGSTTATVTPRAAACQAPARPMTPPPTNSRVEPVHPLDPTGGGLRTVRPGPLDLPRPPGAPGVGFPSCSRASVVPGRSSTDLSVGSRPSCDGGAGHEPGRTTMAPSSQTARPSAHPVTRKDGRSRCRPTRAERAAASTTPPSSMTPVAWAWWPTCGAAGATVWSVRGCRSSNGWPTGGRRAPRSTPVTARGSWCRCRTAFWWRWPTRPASRCPPRAATPPGWPSCPRRPTTRPRHATRWRHWPPGRGARPRLARGAG